jgi:hypothetical protein
MLRRAALMCLVLAVVAGDAQPVFARGGGGPPVSSMTWSYCRETVYKRGFTGAERFEEEVRKCFTNPVTYPSADTPAYK